jgi:hypothetical protein
VVIRADNTTGTAKRKARPGDHSLGRAIAAYPN